LALRLFAMYVLAVLALSLTVFLLQTRFEWGAPHADNWFYLGDVLVVFVLVAVIGALLWRLGTRALRMAERHDVGLMQAAPDRADLLTLQRTLFALLGLYFAVRGLLGLLGDLVLHLDRNMPWVDDFASMPLAWLLRLNELLIGLAIVVAAVGPRAVLRCWTRRHQG
jgi:hypothetical protein